MFICLPAGLCSALSGDTVARCGQCLLCAQHLSCKSLSSDVSQCSVELQMKVREDSTIPEKTPSPSLNCLPVLSHLRIYKVSILDKH